MAPVRRLVVVALLLAAMGVARTCIAQSMVEQVGGFTHSVWTVRDGVPDDIRSMAQTPDGWLWMVAEKHLYRFDGVTAEQVDVPSGDTSDFVSVFAASSGDVWLNYVSGRTFVLPAGDAHRAKMVGGARIPSTYGLFEDSHGNMWSYNIGGVYKADRLAWHRIGAESGLGGQRFYSVQIDTEGTIWVLSDVGVFTLAEGHARFEQKKDIPAWLDQVIQHAHDAAFSTVTAEYGDSLLSLAIIKAGKKLPPTFFQSSYGVMPAADGSFWWITYPGGVRRAESPGADVLDQLGTALGTMTKPDPAVWTELSANHAHIALEDRQHNMWVSTTTGLERFRRSAATILKQPEGNFAYTMLPGDNGSIWFGDALSDHTYRWWHVDTDVVPAPGYDFDTSVAFRDTDGSVLLGTGNGYLRRFVDGKFLPFEPLPPGSEQGNDIIAIARDGQQKLWIGVRRGDATYRLDDGRWIANGGFDRLPHKWAMRMVRDAQGRLWLSYPDELFIIDGRQVARYAKDEGMDIPDVRDMLPDGIALIGGDVGLAAFDGQRFHRISALDATALTDITGIVRLKDGTVWVNGHDGGVRIKPGEIEHALKDPRYMVSLRVFGEDDGMPGTAQKVRPVPSLIEGTDGRLWFADTKGIAWLDPAKLPAGDNDPMVVIRALIVGNQSYRPGDVPQLPAGTRNIEIDYTVIGLRNAAKASFRYQLSGVDADWQHVGARRQAFYTNLGPGNYTFRVSSTNDDNAWGRTGAVVAFAIAPEFYQTKWFMALCVALVLALLWLAYLYHLRQVTQRLRQRLEERHGERDRIARELHDTYMQTVHGLVLKVEAVSHELVDDSAKDKILNTLNLANRALVEGRNRVYALRTGTIDNLDLVAAFKAVAQECEGDPAILFSVTSTGVAKTLHPLAIDELHASGREAIINAFHHASARLIHVDVCYDKKGIRVEIMDDGKGIDAQVVQEGGIPGHWGLRGMRERMARIGGTCDIASHGASGTKVVLFVPAQRAYANR
jgi:signal transduction histidine kinase/ligand-binding sensor domain-containing protein